MALHAEPLGSEWVIRVCLSRTILQASICQGLACEDISIHNVKGAPIEAHVVAHNKVPRSKEAAVRLFDAVTPDEDTLRSQADMCEQPVTHNSGTLHGLAHFGSCCVFLHCHALCA